VEKEKKFRYTGQQQVEGACTWQAPSNIALVKYWGKFGDQYPKNASLSFTLSQSHTTTRLGYQPKKTFEKVTYDFLFEGAPQPQFHQKLDAFFDRITPYLPLLKNHHLTIASQNSFPHSSGIASSASAMAALALTIMEMEKSACPEMTEQYFFQKASFLARLGSGSASRSIEGPLVYWGTHSAYKNSSNLYGVSLEEVHPEFGDFQDTILLVDKGHKKVSSTLGHQLMDGHPFAKARFDQAQNNMTSLKAIIRSGALEDFVALVETEALSLHAMMLSSSPSFILMQPNTLAIISRIKEFREATNTPLCFTLDAGANVHVLYPKRFAAAVKSFIATALVPFCQNGSYIDDYVGQGAKKL
jgi:diphosphomevalonate decarboxylase